ncbi:MULTISPECIES: universal stress protein [Halobellus]|jgi:nucleotide-binding universal stress UspA family protein|uniref:universal stress protein n=1 Tax=Halobellus TaxID=1073986 RepID=UPI0028804D6C|nr:MULTISPECIES: universal stress protein [unclassified Halobellus]
MTTYVLATNHVDTSARVCDYLVDRVSRSDTVHAVNSLPGGDDTDSQDVRDGEEALTVVSSRLGALTTVETHQFVRGKDPYEDILAKADDVDADELVIGIRKRNPTAKVVFGSTAQRTLLHSDRPIVVIPLEEID